MCQALNHGIISHHHLLIHNYTTNIYINVFITKSKIKDYMHASNGVWLSMTKKCFFLAKNDQKCFIQALIIFSFSPFLAKCHIQNSF